MKIELISWSSNKGGAARATRRLFNALKENRANELSVKLRVNHSNFREKDIISPNSKLEIGWNLLRRYTGEKLQLLQKTSNPIHHSSGLIPSLLDKKINASESEIINLHWFQGEMLSIKAIGRIKKPIIFTLHDGWAFCGTEHHPFWNNDKRYIHGYEKK